MKPACLSASLALSVLAANAQGAILHVDNNPKDAANPPAGAPVFETIQAAVDAAVHGDHVLVYPGVYTSDTFEVVNLRGKQIVLEAAVQGDYADVSTFATLDGEDARRCIVASFHETQATVVRGLRIWRGRGPQGAGMSVVDASPRIENVWFQSNVATGGAASGGGLRLENSFSFVQGCRFEGNSATQAGGGVFSIESPVVMQGCEFINNIASQMGGGIYNAVGFMSLTDCSFRGNKAPRGGGLYTRDDASVVSDCWFRDTSRGSTCPAQPDGGLGACAVDSRVAFVRSHFLNLTASWYCWGGPGYLGAGLLVAGASADVRVEDCEFRSNRVVGDPGRGGAIAVGEPGNTRGTVRILGSAFSSNSSDLDGGAIAMQSSDVLAIDGLNGVPTSFESNAAAWRGGAIVVNADFILESTLLLDDSRFNANRADGAGGAIWIHQGGYGPATSRILTDSVFTSNVAPTGGAIHLEGANYQTQLGHTAFCNNVSNDVQGSFTGIEGKPNCFTNACQDSNGNGVPDTCETQAVDCNGNGIDDDEELAGNDVNNDRVPDVCQPNLTFAGLSTEIVPIEGQVPGLPSSAVCWRVYATFRDRPNASPPLLAEDATVTAIYGNAIHGLFVQSQGGLYQALAPNPDGKGPPVHVNTSEDMPCGNETLRYDSYLTIDAQCRSQGNVQLTPQLSFDNFNAPLNSYFGTDNGALFVYPSDPASRAGTDRKVLLMQLTTKSLARPTGSINLRGRVSISDVEVWDAFSLPIPAPVVTAAVDCNGNGTHDALDIAAGVARDCNVDGIPDSCQSAGLANDCDGDGVPDACEILAGTQTDNDANGIPDSCECQGDVDRNGAVNVDDLLEVFATWGITGSGLPADVDGNGVVGPGDIALVLAGWGICL